MSKSFIITGCARSGTAYTAKLLTAAGVPCSHEGLFSLEGAGRVATDGWEAAFILFGGESSWLAAPLLDELPEDIIIFHQLRNPLHVIRSLMRRRFFHQDRGTWSDHAKYARRWMEQGQSQFTQANIKEHEPPIVRCMKYWVHWNQFVSFKLKGTRFGKPRPRSEPTVAGFSYRVEDLSANQLVFPTMLKMITGSWVPSSTDFFNQVPTNTDHTSVDMDLEADTISWSDLPEIPVKRTLEQMASAWGYGKEDLGRL